jgi:glutamyl-tRNA synthetase/nondiscriminating glutamyl-tRNA synthetase
MIHGAITVKSDIIEDFVLLRSDGKPTYHLSAVVDDIEQKITHIIRGDDHISNTPKQILLYQALKSPVPKFAHLALILGPDKKKLSKRHGVVSIQKFQNEGYLPLGVLNYLAQMSWSVGEDKHVFSVNEMIDRFSISRLSKGSPVFSSEKLEWTNGQIISQMTSSELFPLVRDKLMAASIWQDEYGRQRKKWFLKLIDLVKKRNRTLKDFPHRMSPFLTDEIEYEPEGIKKYLNEDLKDKLLLLKKDLEKVQDFNADAVEEALRSRAEKEGIQAAVLIHAVRILVLGMSVSPGIFDVLETVGKEKTIARLERFDEVLKKSI